MAFFPRIGLRFHTKTAETELTWSNVGAVTGQAPGTDTAIDISDCRSVVIAWDTLDAGHVGTINTLHVLASYDGTNFDSYQTPYVEDSIGDARRGTLVVPVGPKEIKLRLTTNGATEVGATVYHRK